METFKDWLPEYLGPRLIKQFQHFLVKMKAFDVPLPAVALVSMLGVRGTKLNIPEHVIPVEMRAGANCTYHPLDQDNVLLPEVLIENYENKPQDIL